MRKIIFADGEIYHVYNRGVNKACIFFEERDNSRFVADLHLMNSSANLRNVGYYLIHDRMDGLCRRGCEKLVDIAGFVLMPNHYHLLLKQLVDGGISAFMHKLGTAYTMYFNRKYQHSGVVFQGVFSAKRIDNDGYFGQIPLYIHANPLKLANKPMPVEDALHYLAGYKWSSYKDYLGGNMFQRVINKQILDAYFSEHGGARHAMHEYLKDNHVLPIEASPR